jgi:hypothetical protein
MTRSRTDRAKTRLWTLEFNVRRWWNGLNWWHQIMVAAALLCVFELLVIWAVRPYLLEAVAA